MTRFLAVGLVVGTALLPSALKADTTYIYAGNAFTNLAANPANGSNVYSLSDSLQISLTFASPLADNLGAPANLQTVTPESFVITDGIYTITNANAYSDTFSVSTDGSGNITNWNMNALEIIGNDFVQDSSTNEVDATTVFFCNGLHPYPNGTVGCNQPGGASDIADNFQEPGTWAITGSAPSAPEPSSFLLLTAGLALVTWKTSKTPARPSSKPAPSRS